MNNKEALERRMNHIANILEDIESYINNLDINIPDSAKKLIFDTLKSKEITEVVEGINERRPPKFAFIGRSGVGKSSLINAIMGSYLAKTQAVGTGTMYANPIEYKKDGDVIFEIIDTRGYKEEKQASSNEKEEKQISPYEAEKALKKAIKEFEPDAFVLLNSASDKTTLREDAISLKELFNQLELNVPLVTVINRVDELDPAYIQKADDYNQKKKANINSKVEQAKLVLDEVGLSNKYVIPVSSLIGWSHDYPENLTKEEQEKLAIEFDGRYNIDTLIDFFEENIDFRAALYMMMNNKIESAIKKIANKFVKVFSTASAGVAVTPIPASDVFVLVPIQILEVTLIAYLKGINLDAKAARQFIMSLGGIALFGLGLRFIAQQGSKYLNIVIPGSGSAVSSAVAYSGTYTVGQAAISYYIEDKSKNEVKKEVVEYDDKKE